MHTTHMHQWADRTVIAMQPHVQVQLEDEPDHGSFIVAFSNSKKRGKGRPTQHYEAWGYCFEVTGHVHVDTWDLPVRDFVSMGQLREYLGKLGLYRIEWEQEESKDGHSSSAM